MPVVGASVMTAVYRPSDEHHPACMKFYRAALQRNDELAAPGLLLVEVAAALIRQGVTREVVEIALAEMERWLVLYPVAADLLARALEATLQCGTRGADSIYVALAQLLNEELVTADRDQATRGGTVAQTWNIHLGVHLQPEPVQAS